MRKKLLGFLAETKYDLTVRGIIQAVAWSTDCRGTRAEEGRLLRRLLRKHKRELTMA